MAKEIERKFIINKEIWKPYGEKVSIKQAYILTNNNKILRVRIANNKAYLTLKGNSKGITRDEFEYQIPLSDALQIIEMREGSIVSKTRYIVYEYGKKWEVDVFEDENKGLLIAEIELENEEDLFDKPLWIGEEVSTDKRYYNFNLSKIPYSLWQ
jgi:CYTH domain-containing protein